VKRVVEEREVELIDYLKIMWRRKGLIVGGTLLAAATALVVSLSMPKTYEGAVTLLLTESKVPSAEAREPVKTGLSPLTFEGMIRNKSLAERAIQKFDLDKEPYELSPQNVLEGVISVKTEPGTNLIGLTVEFPDARLAADIANFVAEQAVELNTQLNRADTLKTRDYIKTQLDDARAKMEWEQATLVEFRREARIATRRKEIEILLAQKAVLENRYLDVVTSLEGDRAKLKELSEQIKKHQKVETIIKSIEKEPGLLIAAGEENPGGKRDLLALQMKSEEFNPVYRNTEQALVTTHGELASLEARRDDLRGRLELTEGKLGVVERELANTEARLEELTRNYALAKDAYQLFAREFTKAALSVASRVNDLKIVDRAVVPRDPVKPRVKLKVALASTLGLMMFTFLAFFVEYIEKARSQE